MKSTRIPQEPSDFVDHIPSPRRHFYRNVCSPVFPSYHRIPDHAPDSQVAEQAGNARDVYREGGILAPEGFVGLGTSGADCTLERLREQIARVAASCSTFEARFATFRLPLLAVPSHLPTHQVMLHPGYPVPEEETALEAGCGGGPDEFSRSNERLLELEVCTRKEVASTLLNCCAANVSFSLLPMQIHHGRNGLQKTKYNSVTWSS